MQYQNRMNQEELALWQRLQSHQFDLDDSQLTFSQRLARENRWSNEFAETAIEEYRRFCFLAVVSGHPVTPSVEVDQVWHLHLTYSYDYWEVFCAEVLKTPLHHGPTKGGQKEGTKFRYWYQNTLNSYQKYFDKIDFLFWPDVNSRFTHAADLVQLRSSEYLILPKKTIGKITSVISLLSASAFTSQMVFAEQSDSSSNYFPWLILLGIIVILIAVFASRTSKAKKDSNSSAAGGVFGCGTSSKGSDSGSSGCGAGCGGCGG
ncbi:MAG: hypothetical protein OQJ89_03825 [Kangiellaceae bacterium]|nr:hypothetical protein [Kangiellaceae bacterium]MCW8997598.1 hypothetical protein [Kangiellaceae bacterium]MCW9016068.1 hypothetical protein [Kangiellaceae bacterium]